MYLCNIFMYYMYMCNVAGMKLPASSLASELFSGSIIQKTGPPKDLNIYVFMEFTPPSQLSSLPIAQHQSKQKFEKADQQRQRQKGWIQ